jgi:hypothetical protein
MLRGDLFVPQYQGPARRPPGTTGVDQLISELLDERLSLYDICKLLGERGLNPSDELDRFAHGQSYEFTKDEGCERLELALAQIAQWRKESASPARYSSPGSGAAKSADVSTARASTELSVLSSGRNSQERTVSSGISSQAYHPCGGQSDHSSVGRCAAAAPPVVS